MNLWIDRYLRGNTPLWIDRYLRGNTPCPLREPINLGVRGDLCIFAGSYGREKFEYDY